MRPRFNFQRASWEDFEKKLDCLISEKDLLFKHIISIRHQYAIYSIKTSLWNNSKEKHSIDDIYSEKISHLGLYSAKMAYITVQLLHIRCRESKDVEKKQDNSYCKTRKATRRYLELQATIAAEVGTLSK